MMSYIVFFCYIDTLRLLEKPLGGGGNGEQQKESVPRRLYLADIGSSLWTLDVTTGVYVCTCAYVYVCMHIY